MSQLTRRSFLELSTAAFIAAQSRIGHAQSSAPSISDTAQALSIKTGHYTFSYTKKNDYFSVTGSNGLRIAYGPLQPAVMVMRGTERICEKGKAKGPHVEGNRVTFAYHDVNGSGRITFSMRFEEEGFWMDPIAYEDSADGDVVSLHYFANTKDNQVEPRFRSTYVTLPGIAENAAISPIQVQSIGLEQTLGLGHSGFYVAPYSHQQWGLPVHYFCAMSTRTNAIDGGRRDTFTQARSKTMVCGLADLPGGDLLFDLRHGGNSSPWVDYRSDLWHHLKTKGKLTLGATFSIAFGDDQYSAITSYYAQLLNAGIIKRKQNSAKKNSVVFAPEFCTWGAQVERHKEKENLTPEFLESLYAQVKSKGMQAKIFSIDDKWEGRYGNLEHDHERLPHFVEFLDKIRAEGNHVGIWTAFMRCEKPEDLNLSEKHMLHTAEGKPYRGGGNKYYLLDFTQPEVEKVLADRARNFMRVYKPALVKFDFGYELPAVRVSAPADRSWAGERLLKKGLDIIITALREVNPDVAVMYYQLSPLFVEYFDLHSTDDLYLAAGDYDYEANRRIYFAGPLTELGVPTYGSSGYDWSSSPAIWFDSVVSGTIGSLNDFNGDEFGEKGTPEQISLYNGLTHAIRNENNCFTVVPFPPARPEAATRGARARSWARVENGKVTIVAQRPPSFDDGDMLDYRPVDARVANLIKTNAPVVISSKTADAIDRSSRLAVVGFGEGVVELRRKQGTTAKITTHFHNGKTSQNVQKITGNTLKINLKLHNDAGQPVEWMQVDIS